MDDSNWDVVIVGAGAAGLMAACRAAELGRRTLLLEKNRKPGVKILMSGGTRCNITHDTDNRGIVEAYGLPGRFLHSPLAAFSVQDAIDFFEAEGVATKVEEYGKIFPVSNKALDVQQALLNRLARSGATLALGEPVTSLVRQDDRFRLTTPVRSLDCAKIILTTGGVSYPGAGTTGDGYRFAEAMGHRIVPPRPALVPITTEVPWVAELRGITLPDVQVRILDQTTCLTQRRGAVLFAHFGLTGPAILDVSRVVSGHASPRSLVAAIDLLPTHAEAPLEIEVREMCQREGKKLVAVALMSLLPRRIIDVVLAQANVPIDRKAGQLTKDERIQVVKTFKQFRIPITGTLGFGKAEVTAGGVDLSEVDSRMMQSKRVPNLYFAGEILDLDGPIGGYNFQAAWSTGWLAGSSV